MPRKPSGISKQELNRIRNQRWNTNHPGVAAQRARKKYAADPEKARASVRKAGLARRQRTRELLHRLKDVPCTDCNQRFPSYCMDFDHRDPALKHPKLKTPIRMGIWRFGCCVSLEVLLDEIAKCDVVCSNCHRIRTFKTNHKQESNL